MPNLKGMFSKIKKSHLQVAGVLFLILLAVYLLWFNNSKSYQAKPALAGQVYFDGEYRIGNGEWKPIVKGEHIPSTKGDVTLRGNFHMLDPEGGYVGVYREFEPIALYMDHINLTIYEGENEPISLEIENPIYGVAGCGEYWNAYYLISGPEDLIEIVIHNPHAIGNETAIDELIENVAVWGDMDFEKGILNNGDPQRNSGMLLMLVGIVFLGIAAFSTLIHVKNNKIIWLLGLVFFFAGAYMIYSAEGVSFWSESIVSNTTILVASMMFYMMFALMVIAYILKATQRIANITVIALAAADAVFLLLPRLTSVYIYDLLLWWVFLQTVANLVMMACLAKDFLVAKNYMRWIYLGAILPLLAFLVDVGGVSMGIWQGGLISQYVFIGWFVIAVAMVVRFIPHNINAAAKAKELEMERIALNAELAETRISTMMSQIRPHFIYNTLGSIEQLCDLDPKKAGELVHDFAKYLRGNFGELDNPKPILMSKEMEHVRHYVSIENVRFPDMTFTFEMKSKDFNIPALTIQPIVENAIKHGLMKLPKGGTIHVESFETEDDYFVSVEDNGVGFDTSLLLDERKHVGLRNIRERLKAMVNGSLTIESTVGVGTKVLIQIPKEAKK